VRYWSSLSYTFPGCFLFKSQRERFYYTIDKMAVVWLLLSLFLLGSAEAGKLLVIPSDGSHWLGMKPIVEELGRRGNQVVVVIAKFQVFIISLDILQSFIVRNAEGLLFNRDLMKKLQDYNFDAILTDPFEPIGAIAGEYLSVPAIYMQINLPCGVDALASQCPVPASYVPQPLTHFTDHMSLWQRSVNLVRTLLQAMACRHLFTCADEIASRLLQRKASMVEIMSRAALWFLRFDFALEIPRPLMPNMIMIGGMATKKPKPLSQVSSHNYICMLACTFALTVSLLTLTSVLQQCSQNFKKDKEIRSVRSQSILLFNEMKSSASVPSTSSNFRQHKMYSQRLPHCRLYEKDMLMICT